MQNFFQLNFLATSPTPRSEGEQEVKEEDTARSEEIEEQ